MTAGWCRYYVGRDTDEKADHHQNEGQTNVHQRSGNRYREAMELGMGHEFTRFSCQLFIVVFASHLDVASQGKKTDPVISISSLKTDQTLAESEGEDFYSNSQQFCHQIVSKFMDEDHHTKNKNKGDDTHAD